MSRKTLPPVDLGHGLYLIDGYDMGMPNRTGTYVFRAEATIVETSASPSVPYLLDGLQQLGVAPDELRYIIVTHIHLDHAGGVGLLLEHCPNARVVVHPKGARHLVNPERLIQGAKAVYGERFFELFSPVLPVPEEKLLVLGDMETLAIGPGRTLQFMDTPGHANHHFSIYDPVSRGVFTGDTMGVFYPQLREAGVTLYLPSTSPNQFDPQAMRRSWERIGQWSPARIYFGHFGASDEPGEVLRQMEHWLPVFVETAERAVVQGRGLDAVVADLFQQVQDHLSRQGVPQDHAGYEVLKLDLQVCAMGLIEYVQKKGV